MLALVASVWLASLLGSAHCAAMCGGFVCAYAGGARGTADRAAHVAYNLGRLASYLALGVVAGVAGTSLSRAGSIAGVARPAAVVAGTLMMLWGLAAALRAGDVRVPQLPLTGKAPALLRRALVAVAAQPAPVRAGTLGALTALLPCGWLWAFAITAAGTGSLAGALVVMTAFWAGTVPALAAVGLAAQRAAGPLRARLPMLTAGVLVVLGLLTIAGKFQPAGAHAAHAAPLAAPLAAQSHVPAHGAPRATAHDATAHDAVPGDAPSSPAAGGR